MCEQTGFRIMGLYGNVVVYSMSSLCLDTLSEIMLLLPPHHVACEGTQ